MTADTAIASVLQLQVSAYRLDDAASELRAAVTGLVGVGIETDWQSPAATSYRSRYEEIVQTLGGVVSLVEMASSSVDTEIARLEALGD